MNELQRLDDKLDLANSATAKLDVALQRIQANDVALDSFFDVRDFVEQVRRRTARINKWLMLAQKFIDQLAIAGDATGFDQGNSLPGFTKASVIILHAFERASERTGAAFGA